MSSERSSHPSLAPLGLRAWALLLVVALSGCDDPAPPGAAVPVPTTTAAPEGSGAPSASAATSAAPAPSEATAAASAPDGATPTGSASGAPAAATPSEAPSPVAARKSSARTGILKPGEADRTLAKGQTSKVRLLDAGAEPREALRYALAPGRTTGLEMGLTMTIELTQGERSVPSQKIPRIGTLLDMTTAAAPVDGALGVIALVREVAIAKDSGLPAQVAEKLMPHLQSIKGLQLAYTVTPEGRVKPAGVKLPGDKPAPAADATLQQMSQSLESMIAPFPEEPVGLGARWEVVARFDSSGTELVQWSTFELKERTAEGAQLGLQVQQAAARADVHPPNLPPNVTASLAAFSSRGSGESRVEFASPSPRSATMKVDSSMTLQVDQGGGAAKQQTAMKSSMVVDLSRKAPAAAAPKAP